MHSVVDWFAYAVWAGSGGPRRALSLSPECGIIENIGTPLDFEVPFRAGQRPTGQTGPGGQPYPLPFHPLDLAEEALRALFGFTREGRCHEDDPAVENVVLAGFTVHPRGHDQQARPGEAGIEGANPRPPRGRKEKAWTASR